MLKSIQETKKLFTIKGMQNGRADIETSKYLLSLSEKNKIEVLANQLENLKKDYSKCVGTISKGSKNQQDDVDKMQLQILIQVIESMLSQI